MDKKNTLFSSLHHIFLLEWCLSVFLVCGFFISFLTKHFFLSSILLLALLISLAVSFLVYWFRIRPRYAHYRLLTRRFRDGEIYQDFINGIDGLFPNLSEDIIRLDQLIDRQNIMQLSTKQAELLALQNQINPHFLYNTLESIRGDALAAGVGSIADITEALSTFFRYTITETRNLVTIGEELDNVNSYFVIQQYRFGDKLSMQVKIEDDRNEILQMQCPKLFLQPIIENAIFHGLEHRYEPGLLTIDIGKVDDELHINVTDNGTGIPEDKLRELNKSLARVSVGAIMEESGSRRGGIALKNVCRRIKLLFGERYGIQISSIVGIGTKVNVILPVSQKRPDTGTNHEA